MKPVRSGDGERILAVFIDFENLALGFHGRRDRFQIEKVLERLVEKGKIVAKKAYADWSRFGGYAGSLHECAIELIEIPKRSMTGKNSADIRLVVDAVDLAYSKDHIDTFVIVSGDSDFSPLVSKLKELGKHVIGLGLQDATSNLLRDNCDEFIYYEDLDRPPILPLTGQVQLPEPKLKVFGLLLESLLALRRENKELIFSSMAKDTMKRKRPSFNEEYFGYRTFSELLEDAARNGLVEIEKHKTSGTYVILRFGDEMKLPLSTAAQPPAKPLAIPAPRPPIQPDRPNERERSRVNGGRQSNRGNDGAYYPPPTPAPALAPAPAAAVIAPSKPTPVVVAKPAPPARDEEDSPRFGRSLMDEIDFDDEIPTYAPAKPKATPAAKPVAEKPPVSKPMADKPEKAPAKPKGAPKAPAKPKPLEVAATPTPPAPAPMKPALVPAAKKPAPKTPVEDEGFGAGLD
jgi:uncharacterized protein (TIGR00288 family)